MQADSNLRIPLLLLLLGAINIASGSVQLGELAARSTNADSGLASAHYFAAPWPIALHLLSGLIFNLLTPVQFVPRLRRKHPALHRATGYLLFVCGLTAAGSAIWMNHFFPGFGIGLKYAAVLLFSLAMILFLCLAVCSAVRRDIAAHRRWMVRAVAVGLAPAVQRLVLIPIFMAYGEIDVVLIEAVIWAAFAGCLGAAEWINRRTGRLAQRRRVTQAASSTASATSSSMIEARALTCGETPMRTLA